MKARDAQIILRIIKVNHAGEHGAIRIYAAQSFIARFTAPNIVGQLHEMQAHEIEHHKRFLDAMPQRQAKPCRLLFLWAWGGSLLGITTALCGKRMIWICTEAVESAVHDHLNDQLKFLNSADPDLFELINAIKVEEESHLHDAQDGRGEPTLFTNSMVSFIGWITDVLIWISTSGDSLKLKKVLRA